MGSAAGITADCKFDRTLYERASSCELGVLYDRPAAKSIHPISFSLSPQHKISIKSENTGR